MKAWRRRPRALGVRVPRIAPPKEVRDSTAYVIAIVNSAGKAFVAGCAPDSMSRASILRSGMYSFFRGAGAAIVLWMASAAFAATVTVTAMRLVALCIARALALFVAITAITEEYIFPRPLQNILQEFLKPGLSRQVVHAELSTAILRP